ncbi:hypothetical protein ACWGKA_20610 [Streptomyces luteogriseus]
MSRVELQRVIGDPVLNNQGTSTLRFAEVDVDQSAGAYHQLANRTTAWATHPPERRGNSSVE